MNIPETLWPTLIVAIVTLITLILSNRHNRKILEKQMKHDSLEKDKERKARVRHDVYLNVAEEVVKVGNYIGSLTEVDISKINFSDGFQGFFIAASKLTMIADQETARLVETLSAEYTGLIIKLMERIMPMHPIKLEIENKNNYYDYVQSEVGRLLSEYKKLTESSQNDFSRASILKESFDFQKQETERIVEERSKLESDLFKLKLAYIKDLKLLMKDISEIQVDVLVCIRKELGMKTNEVEYRQLLMKTRSKMFKQMDDFIKSLEALV